jgi:hypothetical protein
MEIQDGHFQLCQKVADLAWNDSELKNAVYMKVGLKGLSNEN